MLQRGKQFHMGSGGKRRIKDWTRDFASWAQVAWREHDEVGDHPEYYLGIIMGIRDAMHHTRLTGGFSDPETEQGYVDARVLIDNVLKAGDAPERDFYDLLGDLEVRESSQQVWDAGREELQAAMVMFLEDEASVREGRTFANAARLETELKHLTSAMYNFELLIGREAQLDIVKPLAKGCRQLAEGLLNGDATDYFEGRRLVVHTMIPIEEEAERRRKGL